MKAFIPLLIISPLLGGLLYIAYMADYPNLGLKIGTIILCLSIIPLIIGFGGMITETFSMNVSNIFLRACFMLMTTSFLFITIFLKTN